MKALLYANTVPGDYTCQVPVILATGRTSDDQDIVQAFSDDLSLLMDYWDACTFHLWGQDESKYNVPGCDISFDEVVEAFCSGDTNELSVDIPARPTCEPYTENWAIREVPVGNT